MEFEPQVSLEHSIVVDNVCKRYRRAAELPLATTLKSFLLRDLWRKDAATPREDASAQPWALDRVSLNCARGETLGIIGPNGSGKSTLLKLLAQISRPDRGTVHIAGKVAALIELGAGFHPELTGRENILINGMVLGMSRSEMRARTDDIIAFAELGGAIDNPVRTYSSGMYARLGFSVAIHVDPDVLLIDEILSVGDAAFTAKCHATLERMRQGRRSIVLVSHDLATVRSWCDAAVWLEQGCVRMRGPAAQVVDAYQAEALGAAQPHSHPNS